MPVVFLKIAPMMFDNDIIKANSNESYELAEQNKHAISDWYQQFVVESELSNKRIDDLRIYSYDDGVITFEVGCTQENLQYVVNSFKYLVDPDEDGNYCLDGYLITHGKISKPLVYKNPKLVNPKTISKLKLKKVPMNGLLRMPFS